MRTTVAFMTIRETFMHRHIMGFAMTGTAFLYHLMPILVAVHALQLTMFACINLLTAVLIFMAAAAEV